MDKRIGNDNKVEMKKKSVIYRRVWYYSLGLAFQIGQWTKSTNRAYEENKICYNRTGNSNVMQRNSLRELPAMTYEWKKKIKIKKGNFSRFLKILT